MNVEPRLFIFANIYQCCLWKRANKKGEFDINCGKID